MTSVDAHYILDNPELAKDLSNYNILYTQSSYKEEKWKQTSLSNLNKVTPVTMSHLAIGKEKGVSTADLRRYGPLYADFDSKSDPTKAIQEAQKFVGTLIANEIPQDCIIPCISGLKGAGVFVDSRTMGNACTEGHSLLAIIFKRMVLHLCPNYSTLDTGIYNLNRGRQIRVINVKRSDNGKFRVYVPAKQFLESSPEDLLKLSDKPGPKVPYPAGVQPNSFLSNLFLSCRDNLHEGARTTKSTRTVISPAGSSHVEILPCVEVLNTCNPSLISQELTFNQAAFNFGSVFQESPENALVGMASFLENWDSGSYPMREDREKHLLKQIAAGKEKNPDGFFCHAIRKDLKTFPCMRCPHFNLTMPKFKGKIFVDSEGSYKHDNDGNQYRLSNAFVEYAEQRSLRNDRNKIENIFFEYHIHTQRNTFSVTLSNDEIHKPDAILKAVTLVSGGSANFDSRSVVDLFTSARMAGPKNREKHLFKYPGFYGDTFVFTNAVLRKNEKIFSKDELFVSANGAPSFKFFNFSDIAEEKVPETLKFFLDSSLKIFQQNIFYTCLSHVLCPLIAGYAGVDHWFFIELVGTTGDGKSLCLKFCMSPFGNFWGKGVFSTAKSTPNRLEVDGCDHRHLPFIIDDVKQANMSNAGALRGILQSAADGSGRGRLNADSTSQEVPTIKGHTAISAEDSIVGTESSIAGRGLTIPFPKSVHDRETLRQIERRTHDLAGWLPYYIQYLLNFSPSEIKETFEAEFDKVLKSFGSGENEMRIAQSVALLRTSLNFLFKYLISKNVFTKESSEKMLKEVFEFITLAGIQQSSSAKDLLSGQVFLETIKSALASKRACLAEDGEKGTVIGYRSRNFPIDKLIYLIPTAAVGIAKEHLAKAGATIEFSTKSLSNSLDRLGLLKVKDSGRNTKKVRVGTERQTLDVWVFSTDDIFGPSESPNHSRDDKNYNFDLE